ncbi:hypothetical protein Kpol_1020p20 [Vanderwaltozyma polyspora DSM 70294]|uniref:Prokaryotic-type class I peptide chain release factors domain-containing protein n=1 Tax=Vanderwaltozyma polyspora (strain ATCC 22028 / DSM 70294 / BCRC 21397 / CBS 2163 / NBRC 10782 / NRRL Y-8283 / UCD 57-17) TaxID=436907 RepID=A7TLD1_VANPO|nr:uncharacterized protein Kpol_1020p20 [Vanderwaltozyma polyspora DSM 70294]EDO16912.1 hypothetical protein Kpol_1020p20 [Vanderwaltozyma polyspora DSM 70294]
MLFNWKYAVKSIRFDKSIVSKDFYRSYIPNNDPKASSITEAQDWLQNLAISKLPPRVFSFRFDRSSGPGGQNVNKLNTKCTLTLFNLSSCSWIPIEVRNQLQMGSFRYYTKNSDSVVIQSDQTRSRETNKSLCMEKFINEIKSTCKFKVETPQETIKKWNKIKARANDIRIQNKKFKSDKKKLRTKIEF